MLTEDGSTLGNIETIKIGEDRRIPKIVPDAQRAVPGSWHIRTCPDWNSGARLRRFIVESLRTSLHLYHNHIEAPEAAPRGSVKYARELFRHLGLASL